jgi:hypothetical protein
LSFFKCGGSKAGPNIIETASPYLPMRGLGCSGPGFIIAWPFLFSGLWTQTSQKKLEYGAALSTSDNAKRSPNAYFCDSQHTESGALFVFYKG